MALCDFLGPRSIGPEPAPIVAHCDVPDLQLPQHKQLSSLPFQTFLLAVLKNSLWKHLIGSLHVQTDSERTLIMNAIATCRRAILESCALRPVFEWRCIQARRVVRQRARFDVFLPKQSL